MDKLERNQSRQGKALTILTQVSAFLFLACSVYLLSSHLFLLDEFAQKFSLFTLTGFILIALTLFTSSKFNHILTDLLSITSGLVVMCLGVFGLISQAPITSNFFLSEAMNSMLLSTSLSFIGLGLSLYIRPLKKHRFQNYSALILPSSFIMLLLLLTITTGHTFESEKSLRSTNYFASESEFILTQIQRPLEKQEIFLQTSASLLFGFPSLEQKNWNHFVKLIGMKENGISSLGLIEKISSNELALTEEKGKQETSPKFRIWPQSTLDSYFFIKYIEPLSENEEFLGYDIGHDPLRRSALIDSANSHSPRMTIPLHSNDVDKTSCYLIFYPIADHENSDFQTTERWIHEELCLSILFKNTTTKLNSKMAFRIVDNILKKTIFSSTPIEFFKNQKSHEKTFSIFGRSFVIEYFILPDFFEKMDTFSSTSIYLLGIFFSLIVGITTLLLTTAKQQAQTLADEMTISLRKTSDQLSRANKDLQTSNEDLKRFAGIVSHDLKNPISSILMASNILEKVFGEKLPEKGKEVLEKIKSTCNRMTSLITNLLHLTQISYQKQEYVPVDLNTLISHIREDLAASLERTGGIIECKKNLPTIEGDQIQLRQLFTNMISNSIKYSRERVPPVVTINAKLTPRDGEVWAHIEIADNGIGFTDLEKEKIFGMGERLQATNHREGHGFGLAICKRIIERHHGLIEVTSIPGKGSLFSIWLPGQF